MKAPVLFFLALAPAILHAEAAHEHGAARLTLVQEGPSVNIVLSSPLHNIVGFEHAPANAAQHDALDDAAEALRQAAKVLALPGAAQCTLEGVDIDMPFGDDVHDQHDEASHDSEDHHDEASHDGEDEETHSDLQAAYHFNCAHPAALTDLTVTAFKTFAGFERIAAEAATDRGTGSAVLNSDQPVWTLPVR